MSQTESEKARPVEIWTDSYFYKHRCLETSFKDLILRVYYRFWAKKLPVRKDYEMLHVFVKQPMHLRHSVCYQVLTDLIRVREKLDLKHIYYRELKYFLRKLIRIIYPRFRSAGPLSVSKMSVTTNFLTETRHGSLEHINKLDGKYKLLKAEGDCPDGFVRISKIVRKITGVHKRAPKKRFRRVTSWQSGSSKVGDDSSTTYDKPAPAFASDSSQSEISSHSETYEDTSESRLQPGNQNLRMGSEHVFDSSFSSVSDIQLGSAQKLPSLVVDSIPVATSSEAGKTGTGKSVQKNGKTTVSDALKVSIMDTKQQQGQLNPDSSDATSELESSDQGFLKNIKGIFSKGDKQSKNKTRAKRQHAKSARKKGQRSNEGSDLSEIGSSKSVSFKDKEKNATQVQNYEEMGVLDVGELEKFQQEAQFWRHEPGIVRRTSIHGRMSMLFKSAFRVGAKDVNTNFNFFLIRFQKNEECLIFQTN